MRCYVILSALALCLGGVNSFAVKGCSISVKNLTEPQALYLLPSDEPEDRDAIEAFHLPDSDQIISLKTNDVVHLECPGGNLKIDGENIKVKSKDITCSSETTFKIDGKSVDIKNVACTRIPKHTAWYTGEACLKTYKEAEIGFELEDGGFVSHIKVCFDDQEQNTLYSVFALTNKIDQYQVDFPRVDFDDADFYDLGGQKIDDLYTRKVQRVNINAQLGLPEDSTKYIHATNDYYLARGHLTAKTDFIYGSQQRLTFYYINAAPQWQTHNAGNWLALENSVRKFSSESQLDLLVYTGTHGVTTLPHVETGEDVELYLYVGENGEKAVPVPQLFWKVVYDPATQLGVAFVGINNPYHEKVDGEIICKDVCDQISWVQWKQHEIKPGYSYCCTVADFRKTVKTLPSFKVTGLLK